MSAAARQPEEWLDAYNRGGFGQLAKVGEQWQGPCPHCGGTDRFGFKPGGSGTLAWCRRCEDFAAFAAALWPNAERETMPPEPEPVPEVPYGVTLAAWAEALRLPREVLELLGWRDATCWVQQAEGRVPSVRVPYVDRAGEEITAKHRVKLSGSDKYRHEKGGGARLYLTPTTLREARARKRLIVVEGETDCATLWHAGLPAVGLPGASSTSVLEAEHLEGVEQLYVIREPDEAGERFPAAIAERLLELRLTIPVLVVRLSVKDPSALWRCDPDVNRFRREIAKACRFARGLRESKIPAHTIRTAREIMHTVYPPTRWVVRGVLPEGFAVLAAPPKSGKSWAAYDIAAGVAFGSRVCGAWGADRGEVLYLDLEQKIGAKTQFRLAKMDAGRDRDQWFLVDEWPRLDQGGIEELDIWLEEHPACRLVVIDVISRVMPTNLKGNVYHAEYDLFARLKRIGDGRQACILALHHDNKSASSNILDNISGSRALVGAANAILWLQRHHGEEVGKLDVLGRDVEERSFEGRLEDCRWSFDVPPPAFTAEAFS